MMVVLQLWALLAGATLRVAGESFTNGWAAKRNTRLIAEPEF